MVLLLPDRKEVETAEIRGGDGDSGCPASHASCLCPHPCLALALLAKSFNGELKDELFKKSPVAGIHNCIQEIHLKYYTGFLLPQQAKILFSY